MYLEFNQFNKDLYTEIDDGNIGKYIPVLYGKIAAMELTCINVNYAPDAQGVRPIYRMPDGMSDYGTAYLKVGDTWKVAEIYSVDYDTERIEVLNGRSKSGSTYPLKLVDCTGYMFDGHCYPRQAMQHWYSTYGGIEYTDSNFSKTEWESELDDIRYQADFGLLLDDYSINDEAEDDSSDLDYFNKVIFNMSTLGGKMYARVDYTADGKITAKLLDYDRTATDTIQSSEIFDNDSIKGSTSGDTAYAKIKEKYYYNSVDNIYLSFEDSTYSKYVKQNYRKFQTKTDECYLVNQSDALERAANLALMFKYIPITFSIKVKERYYTRLYDVYTIALQPDNLTANTRQYAGNHDCLVTGVAPDISNGYTTLTVQIIPDRTASTQQVAIRTSAYTTISREKTATEIVTDNLQTAIDDNLLLTGYLTVPSLSVVADKDGNVTDYSKATGTFNVKYSGTDVTGAGPVYSVISQTGCTGTIDAITGVYAISALSADVGILTLKATYESKSIETSFTVTKSYTGETGDDGINTATVYLYKQASSSPDAPTNTLTYTFATSVLSGTIDNDWIEEIPDASSTLATYRISAVAASSNTTDTITTSEWSTPVIYAKLGADGNNGTSISISSQSITYQSSSSGTTTPTGTWLSSPPSVSQGNYLWTRTVVMYSDNTTTTSYSVSYIAVDGTNGIDATAIDISDPEETTPEANMVYDNSYYGMYGGQWYMWTWDSETTGYWTLTSATVPTDAVIHYSFDDMPDLPDASGATLYQDNDFTALPSGWTSNLSPVSSFENGQWVITSDANWEGYFASLSGIVTVDLNFVSGTYITIGFQSSGFKTLRSHGTNKVSFYSATVSTFVIYIIGTSGGQIKISKMYIGDGTTVQPIIDNVSGKHNATASGLVSATGVSGKCAQFLEKQAMAIDLSDYANLQQWSTSMWIYVDYNTITSGTIREYFLGDKDYCILPDAIDSTSTRPFYFTSNNGTNNLSIIVPRETLLGNWHKILITVDIQSSTYTIKKLYIDGKLYATATSTYDFTNTSFDSTGYLGGRTTASNLANCKIDDFHFYDYILDDSDALGLFLARGNTAKYYQLADYQNSSVIVTYSISANNSVFSRSRANVISPSTITVTAKQTKLGVLSSYSGRFIIYTTTNGTGYTSVYTSSVNESSHTYTLPTTGITGLRVELYKAGGTTTLLTSTDYSTPYAEDVAPMYLGLGAISTGTKSFVSATVDSNGVITPGSTISNIITGDWALGYDSTAMTASVYYWNGTAWTATTAQSYVSSAAYDILNLTTGGYTIDSYTIIQNAIIKNLMVSQLKVLTNGVIYGGDRFDADGIEIDATAKGFWMSSDGDIKAVLQSFTGYNVLAGTDAGKYLTEGTGDEGKFNVCTGHEAGLGYSASKYYACVFNGYQAGYSNTTGSSNNFIGSLSGYSNTTGSSNNFIGSLSGRFNTSGSYNNFIGYKAGYHNTKGYRNSFTGSYSGYHNTTGICNACFGADTDCYSPTLDYQFNINNTKKYIEFAPTATNNTVYDAITAIANVTSGQISCHGYIGQTAFVVAEVTSTLLTLYNQDSRPLATISNGSTTSIGSSLQIEVMTKRTPTNT